MKPIEREAVARLIYWLAAVRQDLETLQDDKTMAALALNRKDVIENGLRCLKNVDDLVEAIALEKNVLMAIIEDNQRQTR